ncbi:MAG: hypothetical protein P4L62_02510 [Candidatus Pacebacteria bacterium]|nr:hypothetical protein [Candidatus Paceibacterota bacterium]MDR3583206.1 hypothetical protein [Candidatus Paceibacterota bacterium]
MVGTFENDSPYVEIKISGISKQPKTIKALVDTGFNGYLTLPYAEAFPLGLVLFGIQSSTLADGSLSHYFVCIGTVEVDGKSIETTIDIQPNCNVLLGTKLLKLLGKILVVDVMNAKVELKSSN